jgi:corrinoid protein of di/trimethylamine methyltransferase
MEPMTEADRLYGLLAEAVAAMDRERVAELARQVLKLGLSPQDAITHGLAAGMRRMGERFAAKECFVPEVLMASKAMYAGFDILKEHITGPASSRGKVILGVVQGDIHDIGKNIVKVMVQAAGFEVVDLGRNVPLPEFVKAAGAAGSAVLGLSSLMTTTMPRMGTVIELLDKEGLRKQVKVMVGGAPVTAEFARRIGADGFAADAHSAVLEVERLLGHAGT